MTAEAESKATHEAIAPAGEARPVILVSAAPPLEAERLADALRAYLDTPRWDVEVLPRDPVAHDARDAFDTWLAGAADRSEGRATAVVRVEDDGRGLTLVILDRATDKALKARFNPPERSADLYRALALKTEALLRVTFSEEPATAETTSLLSRLPPSSAAAHEGRGGRGVSVGWVARSFFRGARHEGSPTLGGVALATSLALGPRLWLGAELDAFLPARATLGDVSVLGTRIPLVLKAGTSWPRARWVGRAAFVLEVAYVDVGSSSTRASVRDARGLTFAAGAELEASLALWGGWALTGRLGALQNLWGYATTVRGAPLMDMSGWSALAAVSLETSF